MFSLWTGSRRDFLRILGISGVALLLPSALGCLEAVAANPLSPKGEGGVSPLEDLMREHGVLNRLLLVYEEACRRLDNRQELKPQVVAESADLIRRFIEDYHEKLEENHLFPRFERSGKLVDLVLILRRQHQAGRLLTDQTLKLAQASALGKRESRLKLSGVLRRFIRMYRPHEAREDTVLFPAFRDLVTLQEYEALGERFEDEEHRLFGREGFEGVVKKVAELEKALGIYDIAQFTP